MNDIFLTIGGGSFFPERRQGTGLILSPMTFWKGGLRRKGGDPRG